MSSSIPPVRHRCPHCGAGRSPLAKQCWMCYRDYDEPIYITDDQSQPPPKDLPAERPLAFLQTNGGTLLVAAVFFVILWDCFQVAPGMAVILFVVGSVALRLSVRPSNVAQHD